MFNNFGFPLNRVVYEIMWENMTAGEATDGSIIRRIALYAA